jgi:hypothetical protein
VRLFSTKSFKALGTLIYHKATVQALAFARAFPVTGLHHHHPHSCYPAKSSVGGDGGSGDGRDVTGTRPLAADTRDTHKSGDDDDYDGDCDDQGDGDCDDDYDDDNNIMVSNDDGEELGKGEGDNDGDYDDDDEMSAEEKARRSRWLVSGDKDGRVVVWALIDF